MTESSLRTKLKSLMPGMVLILCIIQPLLDVLRFFVKSSGLSEEFLSPLRPLCLCVLFIIAFICAERRKYFYTTAAVIFVLAAGHVIALSLDGADLYAQLANIRELSKMYMLPVFVVVLSSLMKSNPLCKDALYKGFAIDLVIIAAVELLSTITGTDPHTYPTKGIGVLGWFNIENAQSAILSMLVPLVLCGIYLVFAEKRIWLCIASTAAGIALLYFNGTRLAYASIFAFIICAAFVLLIKKTVNGIKLCVALAVCLLLCVGFYNYSPMVRNRNAVGGVAEIRQADALKTAQESAEVTEDLHCYDLDTLEKVYSKYLQAHVDRFGIERIAEYFDYSVDVNVINDTRPIKNAFCKMTMQDSNPLCRLFGLDFTKLYCETDVYHYTGDEWIHEITSLMSENDILGVYYLNGIAGMLVYVIMLLVIGIRALVYIIGGLKERINLPFCGVTVAYCCGMVYAVLTASVLRCTNASFYFAAVLALLWHLCRKDDRCASV